jgi:hypothetical protein
VGLETEDLIQLLQDNVKEPCRSQAIRLPKVGALLGNE